MDIFIEIAILVVGLYNVLNYSINYFKHCAICTRGVNDYGNSTQYPIYEYEIIVDGVPKRYKVSGFALFHMRKGKKYKVLINKKNYRKVVDYREYVFYIIFLGIGLLSLLFRVADLVSILR